MKKTLFALLLLLFASCNKEGEQITTTVAPHTFRGSIVSEEDSRTYLTDDILLRWTAGDLITLYEGTTRNKKYQFMGETGDNAGEFDYVGTGFGTGNDLTRYYALYPYSAATKITEAGVISYTMPATQNYAAGSVGLGANPMVAITKDLEDFDLAFRNVGSFLRVKLYGEDQTVGSITVTTNGGEALSGKATITPVYGDVPAIAIADGSNKVTLNCGNGVTVGTTEADATIFWIVLPPVTASQGITVTVNGFYGGSQSYEVTTALTFKRNLYKTLTRELAIAGSDTGMGVGGWEDNGEDLGGSAE